MPFFVPETQEFSRIIRSYNPSFNAENPLYFVQGTPVTSGISGNYGSWVQAMSPTIYDPITDNIYSISICISNTANSLSTRNYLVDIGVDSGGGTSYSVKIPYLLGGTAQPAGQGNGGLWYHFPLFIKAGSSIGIRAAGSDTAAGTVYVQLVVYGKPKYPDAIRTGTYVTAFGTITGTTCVGQAVTPGTTSNGTSTLLGTTTKPYWWWQAGYSYTGSSSTLTTDRRFHGYVTTTNSEALVSHLIIQSGTNGLSTALYMDGTHEVSTGTGIYASLWSSTTTLANSGMLVYGLGG
jgi:hypothetical protein